MQTIRVLHIVPNMQQGGIENFLMNIYRNIDREKVQFDFLVHYQKKYFFDDEIEKLGGKIYRLSVREDNNLIKYIHDLNKFFKEHNEYRIVHGHMASLGYFYLNAAKENGVPIRIAHSHGANYLKTLKGYTKSFLFKLFKLPANIYWACSNEAGKFLFGKNTKFELIPNAINMKKFIYNIDIRSEVRNELNLNNKLVIGHVGRFNLQKNHSFILDIFNEIHKINSNTVLILIGSGELEKNINESKYSDKIIFSDYRQDSANIHKLIDIFILPSINPDPLPTVVLEAMASAKPIVGYRHGGICEMVEDGYNGYLANVKDVKDLANKIWLLIENQELRILMGNRSEERQKKYFSLDAYVSNFEKLYE